MNIELGLSMRKDLAVIIKGYEDFLKFKVLRTSARVKAAEAMTAKEIVRTIAMSEVSKKRSEWALGAAQRTEANPQEIINPFSSSSETPDNIEDQIDTRSIFKNLKDCIPCNTKWNLKDFDWSRLKDIFQMDLKARYRFLLDIEDLFKGNKVLDDLCLILQMLRDICPSDIIILIGILTAYIAKTLSQIEFNLASALTDLLGGLIRSYMGSLEDFLSLYLQFLVDQIDCILNSIQVSADAVRDLKIENSQGKDFFKFKQDLTGENVDGVAQDISDNAARARVFLKEKTKNIGIDSADPALMIKEITTQVLDWVELNLIKAQDCVTDLLGGEWLVTEQNLSFLEQVKVIATLIDIFEVIVSLGNVDELCTEDNIRRVVDKINQRNPDIIITTGDSFVPGTTSRIPVSASPVQPSTPPEQTSRSSFSFAIKDCLSKGKPSDSALIRQYIGELGV